MYIEKNLFIIFGDNIADPDLIYFTAFGSGSDNWFEQKFVVKEFTNFLKCGCYQLLH